jgi:hypothetical protein
MAINNLSQGGETVVGADQIPIGQASSGQDRRVSANALKEFIQDEFEPGGGILATSGFYTLRKTTAAAVAVGTAYANFTNYDSATTFPAGRSSMTGLTAVGEFVMARDVAAVMFWVALTGIWPTNRDLTVAVLIGSDLSPFESVSKFIGAGRGPAAPASVMFGSPAVNQNNPGGVIKAGEKVRLVARMSVADTLSLTNLTFAVQTLDGV